MTKDEETRLAKLLQDHTDLIGGLITDNRHQDVIISKLLDRIIALETIVGTHRLAIKRLDTLDTPERPTVSVRVPGEQGSEPDGSVYWEPSTITERIEQGLIELGIESHRQPKPKPLTEAERQRMFALLRETDETRKPEDKS